MNPKERRLYAAKVLRTLDVSKIKFDMSAWYFETDRGTNACAAGHLALDPKMQSEGFQLAHPEDYYAANYVRYRDFSCFDAVALFFGINVGQAIKTLGSEKYGGFYDSEVTPAMVAERLLSWNNDESPE